MEKGLIVHTAIIDNGGRVLIVKRSKNNDVLPGYWDIPGGTLEDGEDPAAGAIRETKEETGLDISDPMLFFQRSNIDKAKNKQFVTLVFFAKYAGGEIRLNPQEHDEYAWINTKEINRYDTVDYLSDCFRALPIF
jgi:8-oxo-dGTP diphosphatase